MTLARLVILAFLLLQSVLGAGCGSSAPPPGVGTVTAHGREFEREGFRITVPLRFTANEVPPGVFRWQIDQNGLREAQSDRAASPRQRAAVRLDVEPVKRERLDVNDREVHRLRIRWSRHGVEHACHDLDPGETIYLVRSMTKPDRTEGFFEESVEIMKRFTAQ